MEQDFKDYDYSKSIIGTFDIDNKAQAKEIIKRIKLFEFKNSKI
ncbi:hypothetical protein [Clostridium beijerinckii]|nr:hypothetical protein [Clostridium beijerinckii]